jgi:hypothetical protein
MSALHLTRSPRHRANTLFPTQVSAVNFQHFRFLPSPISLAALSPRSCAALPNSCKFSLSLCLSAPIIRYGQTDCVPTILVRHDHEPQAMREEYPSAIYHVMDRGDRREDIVVDDVDRQDSLRTLAEACQKTAWQIPASKRYQVITPSFETGSRPTAHCYQTMLTTRIPICGLTPSPV